MTTEVLRSSNELSAERTELAEHRTVMAADRSLMAWIRTGLSMISFGFTIYKLLQGFTQSGVVLRTESSPRVLGLFLVALGTVSIFIGTIEYWRTLKDLAIPMRHGVWRPSFVIAAIMSLAGLFMFVSIFIRVL